MELQFTQEQNQALRSYFNEEISANILVNILGLPNNTASDIANLLRLHEMDWADTKHTTLTTDSVVKRAIEDLQEYIQINELEKTVKQEPQAPSIEYIIYEEAIREYFVDGKSFEQVLEDIELYESEGAKSSIKKMLDSYKGEFMAADAVDENATISRAVSFLSNYKENYDNLLKTTDTPTRKLEHVIYQDEAYMSLEAIDKLKVELREIVIEELDHQVNWYDVNKSPVLKEMMDERIASSVDKMYNESFAENWNDKKINLNRDIGKQIIAINPIFVQNRFPKIDINSTNLKDILYTETGDYGSCYKYNSEDGHIYRHCGGNGYSYDQIVVVLKEQYAIEDFGDVVYELKNQDAWNAAINKYTEPIGHYVAEIYGWEISKKEAVRNYLNSENVMKYDGAEDLNKVLIAFGLPADGVAHTSEEIKMQEEVVGLLERPIYDWESLPKESFNKNDKYKEKLFNECLENLEDYSTKFKNSKEYEMIMEYNNLRDSGEFGKILVTHEEQELLEEYLPRYDHRDDIANFNDLEMTLRGEKTHEGSAKETVEEVARLKTGFLDEALLSKQKKAIVEYFTDRKSDLTKIADAFGQRQNVTTEESELLNDYYDDWRKMQRRGDLSKEQKIPLLNNILDNCIKELPTYRRFSLEENQVVRSVVTPEESIKELNKQGIWVGNYEKNINMTIERDFGTISLYAHHDPEGVSLISISNFKSELPEYRAYYRDFQCDGSADFEITKALYNQLKKDFTEENSMEWAKAVLSQGDDLITIQLTEADGKPLMFQSMNGIVDMVDAYVNTMRPEELGLLNKEGINFVNQVLRNSIKIGGVELEYKQKKELAEKGVLNLTSVKSPANFTKNAVVTLSEKGELEIKYQPLVEKKMLYLQEKESPTLKKGKGITAVKFRK
jgi:hypothetical protein